jgi:hypothetical protein
MALEYDIHIKSKILFFEKVETFLNSRKYIFEKEYSDNLVIFNLYNQLGFIISFFIKENNYFNYLNSKNESIEKEWNFSSGISFRLNKSYDYLAAKLNMLDIIVYILNETKEDSIVIFNGDIMILEKTEGKIKLNEHIEFWSNVELKNRISNIL